MIIGSGFIANSFRKSNFNAKNYIIFASGVSNSTEDKNKNFEREVKLVKKYSKLKKIFIYFSTISIYDNYRGQSLYVKHKLRIEKIIKKSFKNFYIFRLPQIAGVNKNKNTLLNYLYFNIKSQKTITIWSNSLRNILDILDVIKIVNFCLKDNKKKKNIINIMNPFNIHVMKIINIFEKILKKKAIYNLKKIKSAVDTHKINFVRPPKVLGIKFKKNYTNLVLKKYYLKKIM
jgi:nucleoside-diphosphate-sugar epimerase